MQTANPRYQSVPRNDEVTSPISPIGRDPSPPNSSITASKTLNRRSRDDLMGEQYGPYSHMQSSSLPSMTTQTYKGSLDSRTKASSSSNNSSGRFQKYDIGFLPPTNYNKYKGGKIDSEPDDFLVSTQIEIGFRFAFVKFASCTHHHYNLVWEFATFLL